MLSQYEDYTFFDVPVPGYFYADAYGIADTGGLERITSNPSAGFISPADGSYWEYDFNSNSVYEVSTPVAPLPLPPSPVIAKAKNLEVLYASG